MLWGCHKKVGSLHWLWYQVSFNQLWIMGPGIELQTAIRPMNLWMHSKGVVGAIRCEYDYWAWTWCIQKLRFHGDRVNMTWIEHRDTVNMTYIKHSWSMIVLILGIWLSCTKYSWRWHSDGISGDKYPEHEFSAKVCVYFHASSFVFFACIRSRCNYLRMREYTLYLFGIDNKVQRYRWPGKLRSIQ